MNGESKYMLPIGFYDLLGLEAEVNAESINILLSRFSNYGYNLIKPPLVEFEENWQKNPKLSGFSFKMTDVFSNKTLLIRSDITTQIARLANTKLKDEPLPMRLSYVGDVLKVKNNDLHADRQLTQVGIELIGSDSNLANLEVFISDPPRGRCTIEEHRIKQKMDICSHGTSSIHSFRISN